MAPSATDQLPLDLGPGQTGAPLSLRPMRPRAGVRVPVDGRHLFDVSWGGLRVLAHLGSAAPRLIVHGHDLAATFPELTAALEGVAAPGTVLDGEIVVPDAAGRPQRVALRERLRGRADDAAPATLVISDLPWLGGRSLLGDSLRTRRAQLAALDVQRPHLVVLAPLSGDGARLLEAARERGLAAIIAKRLDSPYLPGVCSRLWRKLRVGPAAGTDEVPATPEPGTATPLALLRTLPLGSDD